MSIQDHIALLRGAACVPKEPSLGMTAAGYKDLGGCVGSCGEASPPEYSDINDCFTAMLAATPPAYAEALAAVLDGYEAMQWRPIETAPKDGTRILLYYPASNDLGYDRTVAGRWDIDRFSSRPKPYWTNDLERMLGVRVLRAFPPSHWMPLPAAPAALAKPGEKA